MNKCNDNVIKAAMSVELSSDVEIAMLIKRKTKRNKREDITMKRMKMTTKRVVYRKRDDYNMDGKEDEGIKRKEKNKK